MSLTPCQERRLARIAEDLAATDPALARRLSTLDSGSGPRRWLVLVAVLFLTVAGLAPLAIGVACASSTWLIVGLLTATVGVPAGTLATLEAASRPRSTTSLPPRRGGPGRR